MILPVVSNHDSVRNAKYSQSFSSAVVVQDIFVGFVEFADDIEDSLGDLGDLRKV
jgi:hypothetical protein